MSEHEFNRDTIHLIVRCIQPDAAGGAEYSSDHYFNNEGEAIAVRDALCERFGVPEGAESKRHPVDEYAGMLGGKQRDVADDLMDAVMDGYKELIEIQQVDIRRLNAKLEAVEAALDLGEKA